MALEDPKPVLQRAVNLLTTTGEPNPVLDASSRQHRRLSESSLSLMGASLKRYVSKSKRLGSISRRRPSDVSTSERPPIIHSHSLPTITSPTTSGNPTSPIVDDLSVPTLLQHGTPMLKVSTKKFKRVVFRLDPDQGQILWQSKKSGIISIEDIKEIRAGEDARHYREQCKIAADREDRWLTIVYMNDGKYKTLHAVADTKDVFMMWDETLRQLHASRLELMTGLGNVERRQMLWERHYWKGADEGGDQKLQFHEVERLCRRLNIHSPKQELLHLFKEADVHHQGYLDFHDFQGFVKLLKSRPEISRLYNKLCGSGSFDLEVFLTFMRDEQKTPLSRVELEIIFKRFVEKQRADVEVVTPVPLSDPPALPTPTPTATHWKRDVFKSILARIPLRSLSVPSTPTLSRASSPGLPSPGPPSPQPAPPDIISLSSFTAFLMSSENSPFGSHQGKIWQDMTRPLSEYYISSSHNTYLVGHQLVGVSTIEGYIRALLHGCRSVEIDIFDGDMEPMIYHGRTLTSKVSLRDVCNAIAKYAFVASPYPVIISAEIHCSVEQQELVAEIMKSVFGEMLVTAPLEGKSMDELPSPEDLRHRVLLKTKNLLLVRTPQQSFSADDKPLTEDVESSTESTTTSDVDRLTRPRGIVSQVRGHSKRGERPKVRMSSALAALLIYTVGVKCRGINKKERYAPEHMFSLSEKTASKVVKQGINDFVKHNRTHLVRIYPNGTRLDSSNFEPQRFWVAGAQLVAINWQTFDLGYMINHSMFQRNGRSGYVLKPLPLRVKDKHTLGRRTKYFFDVTIISAQQLPPAKDPSGREIIKKSMVDPFVEVSLIGPDGSTSSSRSLDLSRVDSSGSTSGISGPASSTSRPTRYRTGIVKNNGFNPVWEEKLSIPFDCIGDMMDLVFVKFAVRDEDGDDDRPLAIYCSPLGSLQQGYRHLPLHDSQLSQYLFSTLFVHIAIHRAE